MNPTIESLTKKNPSLRKYAIKQIEKYPKSVILSFLETYQKYKNLLKGKLDFKEDVESLSDKSLELIQRAEIDRFIKKNINKKLRNNLSENSVKKIEELYFSTNDKKELEKSLFSTIAYCKNGVDINKHIEQSYNLNVKFNIESIKDKIDNINSKIYIEDGKILIVQIKTYKGIESFGSNKWCISNYDDYFDYYTSDLNRQYIIFDFSKKIDDPRSMIGVSVNNKGDIVEAYDKKNNDIINCQLVHDHVFQKIKKEEIFEISKMRPIEEVFLSADNLGEYEFIEWYISNEYLKPDDIDEIIERVSVYGDCKTIEEILKTDLIDKSKLVYAENFSLNSATEAFNDVFCSLKIKDEDDLKWSWEILYNLISNQMDDEFEKMIQKISSAKNLKSNQNKYITNFMNQTYMYSEFDYVLSFLTKNFKDINLNLSDLKWDIVDVMKINELSKESWDYLIKQNAFKNLKISTTINDEWLKWDILSYQKNYEKIKSILNTNLQ